MTDLIDQIFPSHFAKDAAAGLLLLRLAVDGLASYLGPRLPLPRNRDSGYAMFYEAIGRISVARRRDWKEPK